jgi:hypothetical protein
MDTARIAVVAAIAIGVGGGSYGIASAASGSGGSSKGPSTAAPSTRPWGPQRSDETLLTGETAAKVRELALAKVPGATIVRVETDADGRAAYEAHLVKADGSLATVYVNKQLEVVSVQSGMPGPPHASSSGASY